MKLYVELNDHNYKVILDNNKEFSKLSLLNKYYNYKKSYYSGNSKVLDSEYDALEDSMVAIHGESILKEYGCVGYSEDSHKRIIEHMDILEKKIAKEIKE